MKYTNTPNYILFLFAAIFLFLFYIIASWVWNGTFLAKKTEGFENPRYTYIPDSNSPNLSIQFGLADLAIDISSVCEFIKVDSKLTNYPAATTAAVAKGTATQATTPATTTPSTNTFGDYTVSPSSLKIYSMYNSATGYSNTSNVKIYEKMDASYGSLFETYRIGSLSDEEIAKLWNANESISIDDALYRGVNDFVMQHNKNTSQCQTGLSDYFLSLIQKNKHSSRILASLKHAYYIIVKPRFLMKTLSNTYWQNAKSLTNEDKGTNNTILFVINTFASTANTNTLSTDLSENNVADIISSSSNVTPFTTDSIWCYQSISIAFELYRYILQFQRNGAEISGKGKPAISTTFSSIMGGYNQYLEKVTQVAPKSPLLFLLQNPPNDKKCPIKSTLQKYIGDLQF